MAAPEYLIKLKFSTDVDRKAFTELQNIYNNLGRKEQAAFAKRYGSTIQDMNKLFAKEANMNLKNYEKAAIKTEQNLTAARVRELRNFINKRNEQIKRIPGFLGTSVATAGVATARSAIQASTDLTEFEKRRYSSMLTAGAGGAAAGFMIGGPLGAMIGGGAGVVSSLAMTAFEDGADSIKRSGELFNNAVNTYRATLDFTKGMRSGMSGAGFTDVGEYQVYKQALKNVGIENDSFMNDLARSLASQKETAGLGASLINMRRDEGLQLLYERYKASGMTAREFVMSSTAKGGLNQSDYRADALITLFEKGGLQAAIYDALKYVVAPGESASTLTQPLKEAEEKRMDLENREWAARIKNIKTIEHINMNESIIQESTNSFSRSVQLMEESNILLAGINESYKVYAKDLAEIFAQITKKTGTGTVYGTTLSQKLNEGLQTGNFDEFLTMAGSGSAKMSYAQPLMSKIDNASNRINQTRIENSPMSINNF